MAIPNAAAHEVFLDRGAESLPEHLDVDVAPLVRPGDTLRLDQDPMGPWSLAARRGPHWLWGAGTLLSMPPAMLDPADHGRVEALAPGRCLVLGDFVVVTLGIRDLGMGSSRHVVAMARRDAAVDLAPLIPIAADLLGLVFRERRWSSPPRAAAAAI